MKIKNMGMETVFLVVLELLGLISFAVSGVVTAMRKKMDVFGAYMLALITCFGGGVLRDIILGRTPPAVFSQPIYPITATIIVAVFFIAPLRCSIMRKRKIYEFLLFLMDSIGLGAFTVIGVSASIDVFPEYNFMLHVFIGLITGVGGGVLRDTLAGDIPYIFVKHIYALASLTGAALCTALWNFVGGSAAAGIGAAAVLVIRCLSAYYKWNLPAIQEE